MEQLNKLIQRRFQTNFSALMDVKVDSESHFIEMQVKECQRDKLGMRECLDLAFWIPRLVA